MYHLGLAILRIGFGTFMLAGHGWSKLISFENRFHSFSDPLGVGNEVSYILAVFAEVVCSVLVVLGLFTRFAVIPLIITMLVAAFLIHNDDPWSKQEFALMYAITFTTILFTGPGKYSLDKVYRRKM